MESLALLAAIIVLSSMSIGPLGILALHLKFPVIGMMFGAMSMMVGLWWLIGVPTGPVLIGFWALGTGSYALYVGGQEYR